MNPYEILGVPPTASERQIKAAYRKRARETHPDNGGDGDKFAEANRAYSILMDPELRKRFDETGSIDDTAPLTVRQMMITMMAQMFSQALQAEGERGTSLRHFPLIKAMREVSRHNLEVAKANLEQHRKALDDRQFLLARINRLDDGENLFATIIKNQITELADVVKHADLQVRAMGMMIEELYHYDNEVDLIQAVQMSQYGGSYHSHNSTSNSVYFGSQIRNDIERQMMDALMGGGGRKG